jgi:hypothetical protein
MRTLGLAGLVRLIAEPGRRGGTRVETIAGRDWIADEIHGTEFRVPAATFLQVHAAAASVLGEEVLVPPARRTGCSSSTAGSAPSGSRWRAAGPL